MSSIASAPSSAPTDAARDRNRRSWDDTFVDALCEPPETFTFGGTFAHVITFNAYRRMVAIEALRRLGAKVESFGCPSEYLASLESADQ